MHTNMLGYNIRGRCKDEVVYYWKKTPGQDDDKVGTTERGYVISNDIFRDKFKLAHQPSPEDETSEGYSPNVETVDYRNVKAEPPAVQPFARLYSASERGGRR
jgi:hypothetical protein